MNAPTVLIIDDHEETLTLYRFVVSKIEGIVVKTFTSARMALEWIDFGLPLLVICDQHMPEMDGLTFVDALRRRPENYDTPVIVVSGMNDKQLRRDAVLRGATMFMNKPVDPLEFLSYARRLIESNRERVALRHRIGSLSEQITGRERAGFECLLRACKVRDPALEEHMRRAAILGESIARKMGLSQHELETFAIVAPLYDIGKLTFGDKILTSRTVITGADRVAIEEHTRSGAAILHGESALCNLAAEIALSHHERYDGEGYPNGIEGEKIPLFARIMAVADTYDAMTSSRPYRSAVAPARARDDIVRRSGLAFDPDVVSAFRHLIQETEIELQRVRFPGLSAIASSG